MANTLTKKWWIILIQGLLMIALSIIIFNNPGTVLLTISLWLGIIVIIAGILGLASYFILGKDERDLSSLLWSMGTLIIGLLMVTKIVFTMKAITVMFGLIVVVVGIILLIDSINARSQWSKWWVVTILGIIILVLGIASILNISSGAESISNLIGISVLISGIGLVVLSLLKKYMVKLIDEKLFI
jgi:uncharacterized membrane protein HdeD (DUF308 family)